MKLILPFLFLLFIGTFVHAQDIECFCFENNDVSPLLKAQTNAHKVVEWILIKNDSVVITTSFNKNCDQSLEYFHKQFEKARRTNSIYEASQFADSIIFTKVMTSYPSKNPDVIIDEKYSIQEYRYSAKRNEDFLEVEIKVPDKLNKGFNFIDETGPRTRTYVRVPKN